MQESRHDRSNHNVPVGEYGEDPTLQGRQANGQEASLDLRMPIIRKNGAVRYNPFDFGARHSVPLTVLRIRLVPFKAHCASNASGWLVFTAMYIQCKLSSGK